MNKAQIFTGIIIFSIMVVACSVSTVQNQETNGQQNTHPLTQNRLPLTISASEKKVERESHTTTPEIHADPAAVYPTSTCTPPPDCPIVEGYTWSEVFSPETSYIDHIFSTSDGNYMMSGVLDANDGIWIAKVDDKGEILWQKRFIPAYADLKPALNGNFVLQYETNAVELDTDGNIIKNLQVPGMLPNTDGSYTLMGEGQLTRINAMDEVQWDVNFVDSRNYGYMTMDGGIVYAYEASYVDKSVYYMPIYTDIKVIKVDGNGQVWQRVYGVLVGTEYLDRIIPTDDGGTILAGTHSYEELGSDYDIWLMKINPVGSLSWETTLKLAPASESISDLIMLSNGFLLSSEDNDTGALRIVYLSKNGSIIWQKSIYSVRGRIGIQAAINTANGGLILAGETQEKNDVSFLARFDAKGSLVWEKLLGFSGIENVPDTFIKCLYPLSDGEFLIGGGSNVLGQAFLDSDGAWLAKLADQGEIQGFLFVTPSKFSAIKTIANRPKTIPNEAYQAGTITITNVEQLVEQTNFITIPACIPANASYPTPPVLPSLTPSMTPTLSFIRDLYLVEPDYMQGDDVLELQQRLLALGYEEVGVPDGIFGKMTRNAVIAFQQNNHLEVDGYVGWKTWYKLFSETATRKP